MPMLYCILYRPMHDTVPLCASNFYMNYTKIHLFFMDYVRSHKKITASSIVYRITEFFSTRSIKETPYSGI